MIKFNVFMTGEKAYSEFCCVLKDCHVSNFKIPLTWTIWPKLSVITAYFESCFDYILKRRGRKKTTISLRWCKVFTVKDYINMYSFEPRFLFSLGNWYKFSTPRDRDSWCYLGISRNSHSKSHCHIIWISSACY